MAHLAIRTYQLSKQYQIGTGEGQIPYRTFREAIAGRAAAPFRWLRARERGPYRPETFWALDDVSFEVPTGEIVGIIGRNGAGKSTLLKVLSRITEPTRGRVEIWRRTASLLEVGTGFHPELTGRENIYLNGAILGMSRREIRTRFAEIVAFAEVEKFLDTPVKRYSSGMYLRLAFAVAAHLEPEVLLVDEVLAVGDAGFQKKCLGKMQELGAHGRTVLFVSHSMPAVLRLCSRVLLLDRGRLVADGAPHEVTRHYMHSGSGSPAERVWRAPEEAPGDSVARLSAVRVRTEAGEVTDTVEIRQPFYVDVEYHTLQDAVRPTAVLHFINEDGVCLFATNEFNSPSWKSKPLAPGWVRATCRVPGNFLAEGRLFLLAAVCSYNPNAVHVLERDAVSFQVVDRSEGDAVRGEYTGEWPGVMRPMIDWEICFDGTEPAGPGPAPGEALP